MLIGEKSSNLGEPSAARSLAMSLLQSYSADTQASRYSRGSPVQPLPDSQASELPAAELCGIPESVCS